MKRVILALSFLLLTSCSSLPKVTQNDSAVFRLLGLFGGGTAFLVRGASGKTYTLTNAHVCESASFAALSEDHLLPLQIIEISSNTDLCLLSAPFLPEAKPLKLAAEAPKPHSKVFVLGYGLLIGNALTEGRFVTTLPQKILNVLNPYYITAPILPGNSGSPVTNEAGELIGVAFASGLEVDFRGLVVPLDQIKAFLKHY